MSWRLTPRQLVFRLLAIFVYAVVSVIVVFHSLLDDDFGDKDNDVLDESRHPVIVHSVNGRWT